MYRRGKELESYQERPKSRVNVWNEFEKELIKYVKERPLLFDKKAKLCNTGETRVEICNRLWIEFAAKWNYSVTSCKSRWFLIKGNYIKIRKLQNTKAPAYKKYMDGRLSFLDPVINRYKIYDDDALVSEDKITETLGHESEAARENESIGIFYVEKFIKLGLLDKKESFNDFEKLLIDFVKDYPVLYDPRISLNIVSKSRRQIVDDLWRNLCFETGVSVSTSDCQTTWNRISIEYYRVLSAKEKYKVEVPCFKKYFDEKLNFLKPIYLLIKDTPINVYHLDSLERIISELYSYNWNNFQLEVIDFVKENRIIYDPSQRQFLQRMGKFVLKELWMKFAEKLRLSNAYGQSVSYRRCINCWVRIRSLYIKFVKGLTDRNFSNSLPLCYLRYQKLLFLDEVYKFDNGSCRKVDESTAVTAEEEIDHLSIQDEADDDEFVFMVDESNLKTEEDTNLYDQMLDVEDDFVSDENLVSHYDEPQPSTSASVNSLEPKRTEGIITTAYDEGTSMENHDIKSEECDTDPISIIDYHKLNTLDFFNKIGKYVTEKFPEKKQKDIRLKSWGLVTKLQLAILQEDD